jgi:hypothetical protein
LRSRCARLRRAPGCSGCAARISRNSASARLLSPRAA